QLFQLRESLNSDIEFLVGDGKYGNNTCANLCMEYGYYLISKLQYNSSLFFKANESKKKLGRPKLYGKKLEYDKIPSEYLVKEEISTKETTRIYQIKKLLNKSFDWELNVVIVTKTVGKRSSHVIFFTTDLELDY